MGSRLLNGDSMMELVYRPAFGGDRGKGYGFGDRLARAPTGGASFCSAGGCFDGRERAAGFSLF